MTSSICSDDASLYESADERPEQIVVTKAEKLSKDAAKLSQAREKGADVGQSVVVEKPVGEDAERVADKEDAEKHVERNGESDREEEDEEDIEKDIETEESELWEKSGKDSEIWEHSEKDRVQSEKDKIQSEKDSDLEEEDTIGPFEKQKFLQQKRKKKKSTSSEKMRGEHCYVF